MRYRFAKLCLFNVTLALLCNAALAGQHLFEDSDMLDVVLSGDIDAIIDDREARERRPLTLEVDGRTLAVEVRVRGKSRAEVCQFPPLRVYFGDADGTVFEGQDSLKLITHCYNSSGGDRNVSREYAAYRIFNLLSDAGYRVRLAKLRYDDDRLPKAARERLAVFLEDRDDVADRLGGVKVNDLRIAKSDLNESQTALVYVFLYMIGNTDWATSHSYAEERCCHNLDLVAVDGELLLLPFDFDLSAFVDAPYAEDRPGAALVREDKRRNRVYCADPARLGAAIDLAVERRAAIEAELADVPGASEKEVKRMQKSLDRFYRQVRKKDRLIKEINRRCV